MIRILFISFSILFLLTACQHKNTMMTKASVADSIINDAATKKDYERVLLITDSLEDNGDMTQMEADMKRGWAYHKMRRFTKAEEYYRKVITSRRHTIADERAYQNAAAYLADLLYIRHDYEGSLRVAAPVVEELDEKDAGTDEAMTLLLTCVGRCQMKLGNIEEASNTFERAYMCNLRALQADPSGTKMKNAIIHTANITIRFLNPQSLNISAMWLARTEKLLEQYAASSSAEEAFVDEYHARLHIYKAYTYQHTGRSHEALAEYEAFTKTDYAQSDDGLSDACEYLIAAERYNEAADNLKELDRMMKSWGYKLTLDNIQEYMLNKYKANWGAGRKDSANAVARKICNALDSAITWQKNSDADELAIIYDTRQKERIIEQQRADLSRSHNLVTGTAVILITLFFIIYVISRRRAMRRLAEKNEQLKLANERANETSKMKSDFIKQISHEIRTPLNILSGFTQVLTSGGIELDDNARQNINKQIYDNTNRITELVNKMLELSDAGTQVVIERLDETTATEIMAQAAADSGIAIASHITFNILPDADAKTITLRTNLQQAVRALELLLDNAKKFTQQGSVTLRVSTESRHNNHYVLLIVEDTGIGIPAEEANHIFEDFVQLNSYTDGTGIGLTVARSIARRLGGDIRLDTTYTSGARFIMSLPI
jgi:signal transduction histidine kinase